MTVKSRPFTIVPDEEREGGRRYSDLAAALLEGKTAKVEMWTSGGSLHYTLQRRGKQLRTHRLEDGTTVLWAEDIP